MSSKYAFDLDPKGSGSNKGLIAVGAALVFAAVLGFFVYTGKFSGNGGENSSTSVVTQTSGPSSSSTVSSSDKPITPSVVTSNNSPKRQGILPVAASVDQSRKVRMSVIQLAPSGMYLYVFDTDGTNHQLVYKELKEGLIQVGFNPTPEELNTQLTAYITDIFQKYKVTNPRYVQFVVSSGAASIKEIADAIKVLEKKYTVTKTVLEQEGALALAATIPDNLKNSSFLVDVTPTVTRLSWYDDSGKPRTIPLTGSMYSIDSGSGANAKSAITDEQAKSAVIEKLRELPESRRQNGFVIWAAAEKALRQGSSNRYSFLQSSYTADKQVILNGLNILYTIQDQTGTPLVMDFETSYAIGFGQAMK